MPAEEDTKECAHTISNARRVIFMMIVYANAPP